MAVTPYDKVPRYIVARTISQCHACTGVSECLRPAATDIQPGAYSTATSFNGPTSPQSFAKAAVTACVGAYHSIWTLADGIMNGVVSCASTRPSPALSPPRSPTSLGRVSASCQRILLPCVYLVEARQAARPYTTAGTPQAEKTLPIARVREEQNVQLGKSSRGGDSFEHSDGTHGHHISGLEGRQPAHKWHTARRLSGVYGDRSV